MATGTDKGESRVETVALAYPMTRGLGWKISATHTYATEVSNLTSSTSSSNFGARSVFNPNENVASNSAYLVKNRINANVSFEKAFLAGYKTRFGMFYEGRSGKPYSWTFKNDMNGDGRPDLVVGSSEGDLQLYLQAADGAWISQGPLQGETLNQLGNRALVNGHHSVPLWADVNHDGRDDLIVGGIEFGSPVNIDDPGFPHKAELQEFIRYAEEHHLKINPHIFVHNFKNNEQERQELALHRQAFARLGIPWVNPGTNQHTWRINFPDRLQTLRNEREQGIWFNFGFFPSHSPALARPEAVWALPFLLQDPNSAEPMLIHTPTPVLRTGQYATTGIFENMARLNMPIDYFEHIEYHFPYPGKIDELKDFAAYFDGLRNRYDYNFMTEDQMAQSFLTALQGEVTVTRSWAVYLRDKLKDLIAGISPHLDVRIVPDTSGVAAQAGDYQNTLGVVFEKGEKLLLYSLDTDADVYAPEETGFYIGLSKPATLRIRKPEERIHLIRVNVPVDIRKHGAERWTIDLNAPGMQQMKIFSPIPLEFAGDNLQTEYDAENQTYTITHYGDKTSITLTPANH